MNWKAIARETLEIMEKGYYVISGKRIDMKEDMEQSIAGSILITPQQGQALLEKHGSFPEACVKQGMPPGFTRVENISTVDAIRKLTGEGKESIGVLNFASAKNPGGGFINGAMAQEESLATSSTLYRTLTAHETYYRANRVQSSMMYTDHAIYSPNVVFFRDGGFALTEHPVKACVLTLPAVNMGQVMQKGENTEKARQVMRNRMKLALAIFAEQGAKHLVLGAYGCGVFRNDPAAIALWWKELLEEGMARHFDSVFHAVLDRRNGNCISAFEKVIGSGE